MIPTQEALANLHGRLRDAEVRVARLEGVAHRLALCVVVLAPTTVLLSVGVIALSVLK